MDGKGWAIVIIGIFEVILSGAIIWIMIDQNQSSEDRDNKLSDQLDYLNENVEELIPNKPVIDFTSYMLEVEYNDIVFRQELGHYECEFDLIHDLDPNKEDDNYTEVVFWVSNEGKKTRNLVIDFQCNTEDYKDYRGICRIRKDNSEIGEKEFSEKIINIPEIDLVTKYFVALIYKGSKDRGMNCNIEYASDDVEGIKNINPPWLYK